MMSAVYNKVIYDSQDVWNFVGVVRSYTTGKTFESMTKIFKHIYISSDHLYLE